MKKYLIPLLVIMAMPLFLTSCFDDEEEVEYSEKCYISSFSLGTLKRSNFLKTSAGMDSVVTTSYVPTGFPMTINHRTLTIENLDSLPVHTRLDQVLTTVAFEGILVWRKANLEAGEDTAWTTYSSSDSLDLRTPLHFRVVSDSGNSGRTYTVKVNVHQQEGDSTIWNNMGSVEALKGLGERKLLIWNQQPMVLACKADGSLVCITRSAADGTWTEHLTSGADNALPGTLQQQGNTLFMSTSQGQVVASSDGQAWTSCVVPAMEGVRLVAASDQNLYGMADGKLYRSNNCGAWEEENLDDKGENLPTSLLNSVYYTLENGSRRIVLIGSRNDTDETATVWAKGWTGDDESDATWIYYTPNEVDKYRCPVMENLCIVPYDDGLQALGGTTRDGAHTALDRILHSPDHGISWKTYENDDMLVDEALQAVAQQSKYISAAVDDEQFLWIVLDEQVWRGRITRLGFEKK